MSCGFRRGSEVTRGRGAGWRGASQGNGKIVISPRVTSASWELPCADQGASLMRAPSPTQTDGRPVATTFEGQVTVAPT
jgi:hypothetical protein